MEIEVMIPSPPVDFNFDSACTSPYISASSSPQRFSNFFFSAPTSPTRISHAEIPFNWEEKPGIPKSREITSTTHDEHDDDFAFDFSGQLEISSVSAADELFDGGKIKPLKLKPPPKSQYDGQPLQSPRSPRSPKQRFKEVFSPLRKKKEFDPFAAAIEQTRTENIQGNDRPGRERAQNPPSTSRHKKTRSLSPFRVSDLLFDRDSNQESANISDSSSSSSSSLSSLISLWYRKWKLKDLFLFRSASEGRASNKDRLNKFMKRTQSKEDVKNSSFRSTGSSVGSSVSSSIRRREVSAHELHYTLNRALSEEMKRKTFLPYRNGVLGCLGFIPTMDDSASFRGGAASSMSMSMSRR